jgi:transposase InsO family protein
MNQATMNKPPCTQPSEVWARFRFSVIGPLLAAPPERGELQLKLQSLSTQKWRHPITEQWKLFGFSTVERWYYRALAQKIDPLTGLRRKPRSDQGKTFVLSLKLRERLRLQYRQHPTWSCQLHTDNLGVLVGEQPDLGPMPSYSSIRRFLKSHGLVKRPRRGPIHSPGAQAAELRYETREVRSYQSDYVHALWHLDFHHGSLRVLRSNGQWAYPLLLAVMDDRSRLCCHAQWYLAEGAQELCHGFGQALQKRALPRALMSDNGSAMLSCEFEEGLTRLSIVHETTLVYSPYQNGKQETFWTQIEGRLLAMLEGVADLSLALLNEATCAWVEMEYNRKVHSELDQTPLHVYLHTRDVGRPCPATEPLTQAFTTRVHRKQRRSDGTFTLDGVRFEVPSRYGHFESLHLRYASWDLGSVYLADPHSGSILCRLYPLDKSKNAQGVRAARQTPLAPPTEPAKPSGMAPLLAKLIKDYAITGLPPAYLPKDDLHSNPA